MPFPALQCKLPPSLGHHAVQLDILVIRKQGHRGANDCFFIICHGCHVTEQEEGGKLLCGPQLRCAMFDNNDAGSLFLPGRL